MGPLFLVLRNEGPYCFESIGAPHVWKPPCERRLTALQTHGELGAGRTKIGADGPRKQAAG